MFEMIDSAEFDFDQARQCVLKLFSDEGKLGPDSCTCFNNLKLSCHFETQMYFQSWPIAPIFIRLQVIRWLPWCACSGRCHRVWLGTVWSLTLIILNRHVSDLEVL